MSALEKQDVTTAIAPTPIRPQVKWIALVGCLTGIVLGAAMVVTFYPHLPSGRARAKIAVVDLASVVRKNQEAAISQLANGAADQRTRDAAFASAQGFGKRLDAEVIELSRECRCILLMREAVVAGDVEDLTPALLSRLAKR